jgi:hypothetical protein
MSEYESTPLPSVWDSLASAQERVSASEAAIDAGQHAAPDNLDPDSDRPSEQQRTEWEKIGKSIEKARETLRTKYGNQPKKSWAPAKKESDAQSADRTEDRKIRDGIIKKASEKAKEKAGPSNADLNNDEVRQARRELKQRYSGQSLSEIVQRFESWEGSFRKDPIAAREDIMAAYLKMSPQNFSATKEPKYSPGIRGSLEKGAEDARDLAELKPFVDKYGKDFPRLLQQISRFDRDMIDDPVGTSARLAANYGVPVTAAQHEQAAQHYQQKAQQEDRLSNVQRGLDKLMEQNLLPGIEDPEMQDRIADVLENPKFTRSGNAFEDLKAAWQVARLSDEKRARNERGGKSIKGAPSTAGSNSRQSQVNPNSAHGAIKRAMGK